MPDKAWQLALLLAVLCLAAYYPALNNGFISDDYVMLGWVEQWKRDSFFLLKIVPDVFRITCYVALRFLQWAFGYRPEFFYAFSILVHFLNVVLLWRLLLRATGSRQVAVLAAALFAVVQSPQEAVMWLAAMADALAGLCVLAALLLWLKGRFLWSALVYLAGLFSKESAVVAILLLPVMEFYACRKLTFRREYLYFLVPTTLYVVAFAGTASANYLLANGFYALSAHGLLVLGMSLHRLMVPWLYLAVLCLVITQRRKLPAEMGWGLMWMTTAMLPFVFLTYQSHLPSRHLYIASMGLAWAIATLLAKLDKVGLRQTFVAAFVAVNIGYLWLVKDAQFERRAAPTTRLLEHLQRHPPGPLLILDFPLNPWMAKMTTRMVEGWQPEMMLVNESPVACPECFVLRWDHKTQKYFINLHPPLTVKTSLSRASGK